MKTLRYALNPSVWSIGTDWQSFLERHHVLVMAAMVVGAPLAVTMAVALATALIMVPVGSLFGWL